MGAGPVSERNTAKGCAKCCCLEAIQPMPTPHAANPTMDCAGDASTITLGLKPSSWHMEMIRSYILGAIEREKTMKLSLARSRNFSVRFEASGFESDITMSKGS